jgi:hypothetical protein
MTADPFSPIGNATEAAYRSPSQRRRRSLDVTCYPQHFRTSLSHTTAGPRRATTPTTAPQSVEIPRGQR